MRKRLRKSIAGLLALLMVVGSFQFTGFQVNAEGETIGGNSVSSNDVASYVLDTEGRNITENVLEGYNTNFENDGWWNDAAWAATGLSYKDYAQNKPSEDCLTKYVEVSKNGDNAAVQIGHASLSSTLKSGQEYEYSYYVKLADGVEAGDVTLTIKGMAESYWPESPATITKDAQVTLCSTEWTKVTGTFVVDDVMEQMQIIFASSNGESFCLDNFRVAEVKADETPDTDESQITAEVTKADVDKTYSLGGLTEVKKDKVTATHNEASGSMKLEYSGQYGEINYTLPDDIDASKIKKIAIKLRSGNLGSLALKTYTQADFDAPDVYQTDVAYGQGFIVPTTNLADVKYIGISSLPEGATEAVVESITFTVEGSVTYPISLLEEAKNDGVTITVNNGAEKLDFASQYKEVGYYVPDDVNFANVKKVSFKITDGTKDELTIKTYTQADWDAPNVYQTDAVYWQDYIEPQTNVADVKYIALANNSEVAKSITVESATFIYAEASSVGVNPDAEEEGSQDGSETNVITYNFKDLEEYNYHSYGVDLKVGNGGELTADYQGQYQETFYRLPANIDSTKVKNVELVVTNGANICLKIYPVASDTGNSVTNYGVSYAPTSAFEAIGIMNLAGGANTVKISGVKITVADALENVEINKTYTFKDLAVDNKANVSADVDSTSGAVTYSYTDKWQEVFYAIPEEIDPAKVHKVTFNVSSGNADTLAYKFYTEANYGGNWPNAPESQVKYGNPVVELANGFEGIKHFGIMSQNPEAYTAVVDSVTFHTTGWGYAEETEDVVPDNVVGENIIINGDFADTDVSMWNAAQGASSVISAETATAPIYGEVTTYGKISRDPASAATGDCFQQDVTDRVEKGGEYYVEFYAMLSDEYAGAPDNQKKVEFGPFFVLDGSNNYLGTAYSSELSGFKTTSAKVGEWTKYSGYFTISCRGEEDRVVLRFIEQGTDYGSGDCVKGDYFITGVSMRRTDKPIPEIPEIEQDIPDWRDTIVGDLGAGTIAGTAVTSSEMRDETLMELVTKHFNAVTFGNELKLDAMIGSKQIETVQFNGESLDVPVLNHSTTTAMLDKILAWNEANPNKQIKVRGHVLVWHSQAPEWFFKENYDANANFVSKDIMDKRLEWYIKTMLEYYTGPNSKYKDLFYGWDVVNEAINDSTNTYRGASESSWAAVYGDQSNEYIIKAFQWANKYAPASLELYYNDYNDCEPGKVAGIVKLMEEVLAAEGTRIDAMGMQGHHKMTNPSVEQVEAAVRAYCAVVGKVQWTELDINADGSGYDGTDATRDEVYNKMAYRYKAYYDVLKKLDAEDGIEVSGITFWGTVDKYSWLQTSNSVGGASNGGNQCPLLFDDNYKAKPAYWAFVDPSKLTPEVQNIVIAQKVDDTYTSGVEYSMEKGATKATVIPMWDTTGLKVVVKVQDATVDATDAVTVYVDPAMSAGVTTPVKATVKRADAKAVSGGYEAEVAVALDSVGALKKVAMDVVVVNGTESVAFNDTTLSQETSSKYYSIGLMKVGTTVESGTIVVDGEIDERWATVEEIPLSIGSVDADPTFKVLWDKDYLYVLADVKDSVLNKDHADAWMQDSIEVFIDENNKKTTGYDGDDKQYRINYDNERSFNPSTGIENNVISETKITADGYVIEAAFKWTDITPVNGSNVGFELQLNDAVSSTVRNKINWADDTDMGWSGSNVFGTITLVGAATLPELVEDLDKLVDENATLAEKTEAAKDIIAEVKGLVEAGRLDEVLEANVEEIEKLFKESINRVLDVVNIENKVPEIKAVIGALIGMDLEKEAKVVFEAVTAPSLETKYKNAFAMDIKLFADDDAIKNPLVPVTIRMVAPPSIDKNKKVVVLHYADGATNPEKLDVKIVGNEIEFTTTSFSTFVVANEEENQNTGSGSGSTSGGTTTTTPAAPSTGTSVVAPLTGDNAHPMATFMVMMGMAAAVAFIWKKREEEN